MTALRWLSTAPSDIEAWKAACTDLKADVYHWPEYGLLHRAEGAPTCVLFESSLGRVLYPFLVRPIGGTKHVDLSTPYGYGGAIVRAVEDGGSCDLLAQFLEAFDAECSQRGVVSEFIRLHPLLGNASIYPPDDLHAEHDTVVVDLSQSETELWRGIRKGHKSSIRKAQRAGVEIVFDDTYFDAFVGLYRSTMKRQNASASYRLPGAFFRETLDTLEEAALLACALLGGHVVSAAIFLMCSPFGHYHYSGSSQEGLAVCANHALIHRVMHELRERGLRTLHLGGGLSPDDSLHRFKSGFSPLRGRFYTWRRIHDREAYTRLVETRQAEVAQDAVLDPSFFPLYRAPKQARSDN